MWTKRILALLLVVVFVAQAALAADELKPIALPKPQMEGGKPLMQALKERQTMRAFSTRELPAQVLSNLLWAANGINRPDSGKRTAPTAVNWQEIDVYVVLKDGVYLYGAKEHALQPVVAGDMRALAGKQPLAKVVPVNLVFVADRAKMGRAADADKDFYSATDTGYVSQNVYLFCASEGLATVVRGMVGRPALAKAINLRPEQRVILTQAVGYPKEKE